MMKIIILFLSVFACQAVRAQTSCDAPRVPNAQPVNKLETLYPTGHSVRFECDTGYEIEGSKYALCEDGTWRLPVCKSQTLCVAPSVPNAQPVNPVETLYSTGHTVRFKCNIGYEFEGTKYALCEDGTWRLPVCKAPGGTACTAPHVPNAKPADVLAPLYATGSTIKFVCNSSYEFEGTSYAVCEDGNWTLPVCKVIVSCDTPRVRNGRPADRNVKDSYKNRETVRFVCEHSYKFETTDTAECVDGRWSLPVCTYSTSCGAPDVPNAHPAETLAESYPHGHQMRFECNRGYEFQTSPYAACEYGNWRPPVCRGKSGGGGTSVDPVLDLGAMSVSMCGNHPLIENGDVTELPGGMELKVQCKIYYKLQGPDKIRCVNEKWTLIPVCKPPCKLDRRRFHPSHRDEYLQEGERKTFYCVYEYHQITIRCLNGQTIYGYCAAPGYGK